MKIQGVSRRIVSMNKGSKLRKWKTELTTCHGTARETGRKEISRREPSKEIAQPQPGLGQWPEAGRETRSEEATHGCGRASTTLLQEVGWRNRPPKVRDRGGFHGRRNRKPEQTKEDVKTHSVAQEAMRIRKGAIKIVGPVGLRRVDALHASTLSEGKTALTLKVPRALAHGMRQGRYEFAEAAPRKLVCPTPGQIRSNNAIRIPR